MLSAITRRERRDATRFVFDTVNTLGGWIDDVRMYSNMMNTIRLTLAAGACPALIAALRDGGIVVDEPAAEPAPSDPAAERMATLQITFIHDEPDLRREVPAVPG
ncbi:hypothetical protein GCM10007920_45400 [Ciceribacter naphthalenivorans]|uniref:Uncharacterized protein n=3 Tax=Pseudomonadota TaxID=1224 RepID=A0A512HFQ3_9HYPH|nr:hypothetical protein RNA01_11420 [Ciceribacter naphthalenivorans]GLR24746.1 hypothetical protein GCM10007920_45400 [Ciceribacter naphthalenivorans]GLT07602.1 hypothetical protein GCM10007926_45400 [Sphingomonas psychrolutea]